MDVVLNNLNIMTDWRFCPACNSGSFQRYGELGDYHLVSCRNCSLVFVREIVPEKVLANIYKQQSDRRNVEEKDKLKSRCIEILKHIEKIAPGSKTVLDIGCGWGQFLEVVQERGLDGFGIEADSKRVEWCTNRNLKVIKGWFPDNRLKQKKFDVVWCSHIIEHVQFPQQFAMEIIRLLKSGGLLCITTPNVLSISARLQRTHHRYFIPPEHLTHWSSKSLTKLFTYLGYHRELIYTRGGELQLKEIIAFFLKREFMRKPLYPRSTTPYVEGKGRTTRVLYRGLLGLSRLTNPIMKIFGGNEVVGIFRKY